jgi:uncharacterized membrane protein
MENILFVLFVSHSLGFAVFGKFQTEAPWWQLFAKWMAILGIAYLLFVNFGEVVTFITFGVLFAVSVIIHVAWCRKNHIHPMNANPRKTYYALRGWEWKE